MPEDLKQTIYQFLQENYFVTLATTTSKNTPHAATVFYTVDKDLNGYFITKSNTQKCHDIENNSHVFIVATDKETFTTIQIRGTAQKIPYAKEISLAMIHLQEKSNQVQAWSLPVFRLEDGEFTVFKVKPKNIRLGRFDWDREIEGNYFEEIDFSKA